MPTSGDLKSGDFFFRLAPPPPRPNSSMRPLRKIPFLIWTPTCNFARKKRGYICQGLQLVEYLSNQTLAYIMEGTGERDPGRRGDGRGQEAGEQGAGSGIYMRVGSGSRNKESNSLFFITWYYSVKNTHLAKI